MVEWTPARRAEHSKRTRAGLAKSRARRRLTVARIDDHRRTGVVHEALAPIVALMAQWAGELVQALGGDDVVTPQQRALIDQAAQAAVLRSACFQVFARDGNPAARAAERFQGAANVERAALLALGLGHRGRPTSSDAPVWDLQAIGRAEAILVSLVEAVGPEEARARLRKQGVDLGP